MSDNKGLTVGEAVGAALAGYLSWVRWHSVTWAVIHAICGWVYVIYSLVRFGVPH
ncbi:Uncharacterised protein [uncultured archaeon]|nr:Uncharacterised protein [uncultured archaeon]